MDHSKFQRLVKKLYTDLVINKYVVHRDFLKKAKINKNVYIILEQELITLGLELKNINGKTQLKSAISLIDDKKLQKSLLKNNIKTPLCLLFSTDSTNKQAKQDQGNIIVIAEHQKAAYGRNSKQWISPIGQSIAMSIKHRFNISLDKLSGLNIAVGVAVMKTLRQLGLAKLGLKWPNDIIGKQGKAAGIIIEATGNSKQSIDVVIGIGINWSVSRSHFQTVTQDCMNIGLPVNQRSEFISELIFHLYETFDDFEQNQLKNIKDCWHNDDIYKDQTVEIVYADKKTQGIYMGIDTNGALLLKTQEKLETIINGEVSLRPLAKVD